MSHLAEEGVADRTTASRPRPWAGRAGVVVFAVGVQAAALLILGGITVLGPLRAPETVFPLATQPALPSPLLKPAAAFSAFRAASAPAARASVLASTSSWDDLVAPPPDAPVPPPPGPPPMLAGDAAAMGEAFIAGAEAPPGPSGDEVGLLGLVDRAERVVVAVDVSASVVNKARAAGVPMTRIRDEAKALVEGLGPGVMFGLVQFSRGHEAFRPGLVPGTRRMREEAMAWLEREFVTDGRSPRRWTRGDPDGILAVIREVFAWDPDVIYVVSDASFQTTRGGGGGDQVGWDELGARVHDLREEGAREARLHFLLLKPKPADRGAAEDLAESTGGRVKAW